MSSDEDERYGERYFRQRIFRCSSVKRLISFPLECGGSVQLEVEEEAGTAATRGLYPSDVVETVANSFEATLAAVKPAAILVASNFRSIAEAPEGVEVEFGVKFAGQAGAFIASASTEAQFRVKLVWQSKRAT
jgi:Trypsin-co-occurring domain 1